MDVGGCGECECVSVRVGGVIVGCLAGRFISLFCGFVEVWVDSMRLRYCMGKGYMRGSWVSGGEARYWGRGVCGECGVCGVVMW